MPRRAAWLLLVLLMTAALVLGAYLYGRYVACPPPDWWVRLFLRSGNVGCVSG